MASGDRATGMPAACNGRSGAGGAQHPMFARVWSHVSGMVGSEAQRSELLRGLRGRVIELGAGDGRNFAHYPAAVTEVVAIEPEGYLRRLASAAARASRVRITVIEGSAERLELADGAFDAAVSSLVLCSVPDQSTALAELHRVLVPGGELRFFEHVVAEQPIGKALQSKLDQSGLWPHLGGGCHLARDTVSAIAASGFEVERMRRFTSGPGPLGLPFVLGTARREPVSAGRHRCGG
jgi:ubiquinone/menaquinone biosynthesis C-methylase UbiE